MTVGSHQTPLGKDNARFTPRRILDPLGAFSTDAAAGDPRPWNIGTERNITKADNVLTMDWRSFGRTWLNPPFMRYGVGEFVRLMAAHNHGILLLHVRSDTPWYQNAKAVASGYLELLGRVTFCYADGTPCRIENPKSKYFGQVANSGAPVILFSFGMDDLDLLIEAGLPGRVQPLRFPQFMLVALLNAEQDKSWRQIVADWLKSESGPVSVAQLYQAFRAHPKSKRNPNWQAKLRQTLQRGAGRSTGHDQWVAA